MGLFDEFPDSGSKQQPSGGLFDDFPDYQEPSDHIEEDRGLLGDIGSHLARGGVRAVGMAGHAMEAVGLENSVDEWAEGAGKKYDFLKPDIAEVRGEDSYFRQKVMEGIEGLAPSAVPLVAGAAGTMVAGPVGGVVAGLGSLGGLFGLGTYQEKMEELETQAPDLDESERKSIATKYALVESGGELASDLIVLATGGVGKVFGQGGKQAAKQGLKALMRTSPKEIAKDLLIKTYPSELATEAVQGKLQSDLDYEAGLADHTVGYLESAIDAAIPTAVMTLTFGLGAHGYSAARKHQLAKSLNSEHKEVRKRAVEILGNNLAEEDPEIAEAWVEYAHEAIADGEEIDTGMDLEAHVEERQKKAAARAEEEQTQRREFPAIDLGEHYTVHDVLDARNLEQMEMERWMDTSGMQETGDLLTHNLDTVQYRQEANRAGRRDPSQVAFEREIERQGFEREYNRERELPASYYSGRERDRRLAEFEQNRTGAIPVTEENSLLARGEQTDRQRNLEQQLSREEQYRKTFSDLIPDKLRPAISVMEREMAEGEVGQRFQKPDGSWDGVKSTNPTWMQKKTLEVYDRQNGTSLARTMTKENISRVITKVRSGDKLTPRQADVWEYLTETATKLEDTHPELITGRQLEMAEQAGVEITDPHKIAVGNLHPGDKVLTRNREGIPDLLTHKGFDEDGKAILQDGTAITADPFEELEIMGATQGSGAELTGKVNSDLDTISRLEKLDDAKLFQKKIDESLAAKEEYAPYAGLYTSAIKAKVRELENSHRSGLARAFGAEPARRENPGATDDLLIRHQAPGSIFEGLGKAPAEGPQEYLRGLSAESVGQQARSTTGAPKIEDFGEKIGGARKDYYAAFVDQMRQAENSDAGAVPFSKSWPEPDYQKLLDDGIAPWQVAYVRSFRDEVPPKPRSNRVARWAELVKGMRETATRILSGEITKEKVFQVSKDKYIADKIIGRAELYKALGHELSFKGYTLQKHTYQTYKGKQGPITIWSVEKQHASRRQLDIRADGSTMQEAIDNFRPVYTQLLVDKSLQGRKGNVKFDIYSKGTQQGYFIGKKIGSGYVDLHKAATIEEARTYLRENQAELEAQLARYKTVPNERRDSNRERIGKDHRNGKDVTPEMFTEAFGFRGVEFGNWVNGAERQENLNNAYDALVDLSTVLDIPTQAISLNGELGLAFGARGHGRKGAPIAHYEPGKVVINLTKKKGAGSLAHEWFHAMDNYFSRMRGKDGDYVSERPYELTDKSVRKEVLAAIKEIMRTINDTKLPKRSSRLDARRSKRYWGTGVEMVARAFENYIIDRLAKQGGSNDYLANVQDIDKYGEEFLETLLSHETLTSEDVYPYLLEEEIERVGTAFDKLFKTIKTKQTEKGTALYSRTTERGGADVRAELHKGLTPKGAKRLLKSGKVVVVGTQEELPGHSSGKKSEDKGRIAGATIGNTVYLVEENIRPGKAMNVLAHELGVHVGFRELFGADADKIFKRFAAFKDRDGRTGQAVRDAYARVPKEDAERGIEDEEALAYFIENRDNYNLALHRRIITAIKAWLVKHGFRDVDTLSVDDLASIAVASLRGTVKNAETKGGAKQAPLYSQNTFQPVTAKTVESPEFKKWFGGSKILSPNGKPAMVYHGSPETFFKFDNKLVGANTGSPLTGLGHFFATDRSDAAGYAKGTGNVHAFFVKMEKPFVEDSWNIPSATSEQVKNFRNFLISQGYDGVIIRDEGHLVSFSPKFVKSAELNTGKFDITNEDVRYSIAADQLQDDLKETAGTIVENFPDKKDSSVLDRALKTPEFYFKKDEAGGRVMEAALNRRDKRFRQESAMLGDYVKTVQDIAKKHQRDYQKASSYLVNTDRSGEGFSLQQDGEEWAVISPKGEIVATEEKEEVAVQRMIEAEADHLRASDWSEQAVTVVIKARELANRGFDIMAANMRRIIEEAKQEGRPDPFSEMLNESERFAIYAKGSKTPLATFETESEAVARLKELSQIVTYTVYGKNKKKGFTNQLQADKHARDIGGRVERDLKYRGLEVKKRADHELSRLTIQDALALMGDLRGSYFPRIREPGGVVLKAFNDKGEKIREHFDVYLPEGSSRKSIAWIKKRFNSATPIGRRARELAGKGYKVEISKDTSVSEDVFEAQKLMTSVDAILKEAVDRAGNTEKQQEVARQIDQLLTSQIADLFKERGYLSSRKKRVDDVWTGYEEDALKAYTQYARNMAAGTAKRDTAREMIMAFLGRDVSWKEWKREHGGTFEEYQKFVNERRIDPGKQKNLYHDVRGFIEDVLRNEETVDRMMGTLKGLAVVKFLGFRVSSAAVNLTNLGLAVPATMAGNTGMSITKSLNHVRRSMGAYTAYRLGREVSAKDKAIFDDIARRGWDADQFNEDAAHVLKSKLGVGWDKFVGWSMAMFGVTERINRAVTIHAAYKAVLEKKPGINPEKAMHEAHHISNRAHGVYGKETLPAWARGPSNVLKLTYTFQKFAHNYFLNMTELGLQKRDYKAAGYMLLAPAILSGAGASAATPLLIALGKAFGIDDPEEEFYSWAEETFGGGEWMRHGMAGLGGHGINLKGSLQPNFALPSKTVDLFGAPVAVLVDEYEALNHFGKGELVKGFEKMLPGGIGAPLKAAREHGEGVTTGGYSPVFYGEQPLKGSFTDAMIRFFSFNPSRLSGIREKQWNEKKVAMAYNEARSEIYGKLKKYYLQAEEDRDLNDLAKIMKEVAVYNDRVRRSGRVDLTYITNTSIRSTIRRAFRPNRTERLRDLI